MQGANGDGKGDREGEKPRAPRVKIVPLPQKREVSDKHRANLHASGLSDETIELAKLYTEINPTALAALVSRKAWPRSCGNGLVFPFYLPGQDEPYAYRVRPTTPRVVGQKRDGTNKVAKYDQSHEAGVLVYYTPRARAGGWYRDKDRTLYWTEGEKKALALDQLDLACVGLTGVWNYADTAHKDETGERLHPSIRDHVAIAGRHHVIVYDADARTKDQVMDAAGRLCGVLLSAGALTVRFVCPPHTDHKGIDDYFAAFGEAITRQLIASAEPIEPIDPKEPLAKLKSSRALREAPISSDLRLPPGYTIERDGALWKTGNEKQGDIKIARGPILVQRYLDDYYTHEGRTELCFARDGHWVSVCVARKAIVDSRTMVAELSPYGAPVTSNNAARLVDWIDELERVNVGRVERVACVGRTGWHTINGSKVFVLGEPLFAEVDEDTKPPLDLDTRGDRRKLFSAFKPRGGDEGAERQIAALRRAWEADPVCAAMITGALAAPLLEPLGAPNFAIHLPGDSSRGKTTMLKIAASVYGDPNDNHWVAPWASTVGAELRAAILTDMPQCYDEVGTNDPQQIEKSIYMLINGAQKPRGQRDLQLRETATWRTIVLSTGERELADETAATGAQIRVIQLPVTGFGNFSAQEIDELRESCAAYSGAFGRLWIETLLDIDDWAAHRASYRDFAKIFRSQSSDPLKQRLAGYYAVLCVAEHIASQLGLGEQDGRTIRRFYAEPSRQHETKGMAERARDAVLDWVLSEPDSFPEIELSASGTYEPKKTHGRVTHGFRKDGTVLFIRGQLQRFLEDRSFTLRPVLREWLDKGWLKCDYGRHDKNQRIGDRTARFITLIVPGDFDTPTPSAPESVAGVSQ